MRIGIDISQTAYQGTGVANYTINLVRNLLRIDKENEYLLFFSSLRRKLPDWANHLKETKARFKIRKFKLPLVFFDWLWNRLHLVPIEYFIGEVDVFISSDWIQPKIKKAKPVTIIHDLIPLLYPETLAAKIVKTHQRRLKWVKKECDLIICDSKSTKKDVKQILAIPKKKLKVVYPGNKG